MKYIFTESQIKKIIDNQLNEQKGFWAPPQPTAKALLKDIRVNMEGYQGDVKKIKTALQSGQFKVKGVSDWVKLNGKTYNSESIRSKNLIVTSGTLIELSGSMQMSGEGMPECEVRYEGNGGYLEFIPQYQ